MDNLEAKVILMEERLKVTEAQFRRIDQRLEKIENSVSKFSVLIAFLAGGAGLGLGSIARFVIGG